MQGFRKHRKSFQKNIEHRYPLQKDFAKHFVQLWPLAWGKGTSSLFPHFPIEALKGRMSFLANFEIPRPQDTNIG